MGYLCIMERQYKVEKAFEKLLKKMLSEKYPMFLDVRVVHSVGLSNLRRQNFYEVILVILDENLREMETILTREVEDYIKNLAKYMDIRISEVLVESIDEDEWEEMKIMNEQNEKKILDYIGPYIDSECVTVKYVGDYIVIDVQSPGYFEEFGFRKGEGLVIKDKLRKNGFMSTGVGEYIKKIN